MHALSILPKNYLIGLSAYISSASRRLAFRAVDSRRQEREAFMFRVLVVINKLDFASLVSIFDQKSAGIRDTNRDSHIRVTNAERILPASAGQKYNVKILALLSVFCSLIDVLALHLNSS